MMMMPASACATASGRCSTSSSARAVLPQGAGSSRQVAVHASARPVSAAAPVSAPAHLAQQRASSVIPKAVALKPSPSPSTRKDSQYEIYTLTTWLLREEQKGTLDGELATVIASITLACKQIASLVSRSGISNLTGTEGGQNFSGEDQKKLDVISNEVFCNCLRASGRTGVLASEEEDLPIAVEETYSGNYIVVFDPLDGSSNIDAGISVGSIFGVYEPSEECPIDAIDDPQKMMEQCVLNVCQPGKDLKCAGYCLYSSASIMVLSIGQGVYGFTLDPLIGEFVLTHRDVKIPESGKIYSFNEGNYRLWDDNLRAYIEHVKDPAAHGGKPYSGRYIGSLVGDFHRTLLYGGIYGYPGDTKNPSGKLRLLYECAPMSFLAEQAGGKGSTGSSRMLEVMPQKVHQREPLFVGSKKEVELLESFVRGERK